MGAFGKIWLNNLKNTKNYLFFSRIWARAPIFRKSRENLLNLSYLEIAPGIFYDILQLNSISLQPLGGKFSHNGFKMTQIVEETP